MILKAEIIENGVLRIKSPDLKPGDEVILETFETKVHHSNKGRWSEIENAFEDIDRLDHPRRTHEEILHAIREMRS